MPGTCCSLLLPGATPISQCPPRRQEGCIQPNPLQSAQIPPIAGARRPFLVALALTALMGAVELTPPDRRDAPPFAGMVPAAPAILSAAPATHLATATPDSAALERDIVARYAHQPLARLLGSKTREPGMANRIARALVKEAKRLEVEPSLLTGVLLTENTRLEVDAVSSQGAIGLMQVMQFHAGEFDCESDDLRDVEANICHGAHVFGRYLKRTGNVKRALLRYNGCVRGTNTPNCGRYPAKVLRAAHQVRHELLKYSTTQ